MTNNLKFDLEERTYKFAKKVRMLIKEINKTTSNIEDGKQLIRSSGSIGANYIEANESLSRKDFLMRIKICKKETKESRFWLNLLEIYDPMIEKERQLLILETNELMKIFGSIIKKCG